MIAKTTPKYRKLIGAWLMIGAAMIFIQVIIGGITRLTGSGLSITKWEIVVGSVPPLSTVQWEETFELYKQSPQYQRINEGMTLSEYKFIYFWEWFHRFWARLIGVVFLIPFFFFLAKKKLDKPLIRKAGIAFVLGALVGIFGWLMVASGLVDRPMVSPYRLAIHLGLAIITMVYLFWVALDLLVPRENANNINPISRKNVNWIIGLISIQILFGALVSGMRAALYFPTWPDMNGYFLPPQLTNTSLWSFNAFLHFDTNPLAPAVVQFFHRMLAYLMVITLVIWMIKVLKSAVSKVFKSSTYLIGFLLAVQLLLGIFILLHTKGSIPVFLGVVHQGVAMLLLLTLIFLRYRLSKAKVLE